MYWLLFIAVGAFCGGIAVLFFTLEFPLIILQWPEIIWTADLMKWMLAFMTGLIVFAMTVFS